ncbi:MAG: hypothetical protein ACK5NT_14355 [Pyrinomonadaceae bacterium]
MKSILLVVIVLVISFAAYAQTETPISQAEYVKMLYKLDSDPASKDSLIQEIRTRGIGFKLSSGIRSLTTSKSKNDQELKRALEEANRRRENPEAAKRPNVVEASALLEKTRENTLSAVDEMPDFVVKQLVRRGIAYAGTNNFRSIDHLIVGVSYLAKGEEEYKVLSVNGIRQPDPKYTRSYSNLQGTSSTGEFVTVLATIFKPESDTKFEVLDTDSIGGKRAVIFDFSIQREKARETITSQQLVSRTTTAGMRGKIWIDRDKARVLRIESTATDIPIDFPVTSAKRIIDYGWVKINDEAYLLPSDSEVRLTSRQDGKEYETKNQILFKDYQKYGSEVIILDDDEVVDEPKKSDENLNDKLLPPPPPPIDQSE